MEIIKSDLSADVLCLSLEVHKLDMSNAAEFKKKVGSVAQNASSIVLDMSQVDFVDSSGLGAILSFLRDLRARGGELRLCSVQPRVMAMFELVRMQKIVPLSETREAAAAAFAI